MKEIDTEKFLELAKQARAAGTCRSVELARMVETVCKKALCFKDSSGRDFLGYSEDLKLDMYGNAVLRVYDAILNKAVLDNGKDLFNYVYTTAVNSMRKTIKKFYRSMNETFGMNEDILRDYPNPAFSGNKRKANGIFVLYEKKVFEVAAKRHLVRLQKIIRLSVAEFVTGLNKRKIKNLIRFARKIREEASC